jgi:hypothetical protein
MITPLDPVIAQIIPLGAQRLEKGMQGLNLKGSLRARPHRAASHRMCARDSAYRLSFCERRPTA